MGQFSDQLEADWADTIGAVSSVFTTQAYVEALKSRAPATLSAIAALHGPGGRGGGNFYSPANIAFNFLKRKSKEGIIFRRQFVPSTSGWGSHIVAQWELVSPISSIPPDEGEIDFAEGGQKWRRHLHRERHIGLRSRVLKAREIVGLSCDCCGRTEPQWDIELQRAIFEVHHRTPLAAGIRKTTLADVDLLCATCHRLIHRAMVSKKGDLTVDQLRTMLGWSAV